MKTEAKVFNEIVNKRRSFRLFEKDFNLPKEVVKNSLERAIKSPNSSNMQLWEFYRIQSKEALKEVAQICLNQKAAQTASEIVVFVARPDLWKERKKVHLKRLEEVATKDIKNKLFGNSEWSYYTKVIPMFYNTSFPCIRNLFKRLYIWNKRRKAPFMTDIYSKDVPIVAQKSTALAAQTFMLSITAEGYDSLAMEGLDAKRMKQFLKLPKKAEINMAIAVGKGLKKGLLVKQFRLDYETVVFDL